MKRLLIVLSIGCSLALAQPSNGSGPATYTELKAYLGLSDDQLVSLRQIQQQQDAALLPRYQQIADMTEQLLGLLATGGGDASRIGQLELAIANLRKDALVAARPYRSQAFAILTDDQKLMLVPLANALTVARLAHSAVGLRLLDDPAAIGSSLVNQ